MSKLFVDEIVHQSSQGSGTITLGASGETVALASGASQTMAVNTPAFYARLSGNKGGYGAGATTKVQFDSEVFDTDNAYDNSTNYRFTVPSGKGGKYLICCGVRFYSTNNSRAVRVSLYKNGSPIIVGGYFLTSQYFQNDQPNAPNCSVLVDLAVGDYVEVYGFMYDGGTHYFYSDYSYFSGFKIVE